MEEETLYVDGLVEEEVLLDELEVELVGRVVVVAILGVHLQVRRLCSASIGAN